MLKIKGFTLIELMITLVILGIVVGLAAPAMSNFLVRQRVSGQASELMLALAFARSEAVKQGVSIAVIPATNASTGWSDGWCVGPSPAMSDCDDDSDVLRVFDAAKGVNITASYLQSGSTALTFARNGSCPNCLENIASKRFKITSPQLDAAALDARCIKINFQGRATQDKKSRDANCI